MKNYKRNIAILVIVSLIIMYFILKDDYIEIIHNLSKVNIVFILIAILFMFLYVLFQSFPASGSFPMSQFFISGGQSIGVSVLAAVLPMNIRDWFPLGWTGWVSLQSKGHSRVFSSTTVQKHQFFSTPLSLVTNSHIHTWPLEKP